MPADPSNKSQVKNRKSKIVHGEGIMSDAAGTPLPQFASPTDELRRPAIVVRGSSVTLPVAHVYSVNVPLIARELSAKVSQATDLFADAPVVLDLADVEHEPLDVTALVEVMRSAGVMPIAVRHGSRLQQATARRAGLGVVPGRKAASRPAPETPPPGAARERLFTQPVRSGQRVFVPTGDLVVVGQVNTGAEVLAAGNIHVYGPLRGRAMAGVSGDTEARILTTCLEAQLVSVAGVYRALEDDLAAEVRGRPAQVVLVGDRLVIEPFSLAGETARKSP
jgi:septum site-determining protein MinC